MQKIIVVAGPTASGKTSLAVEICKSIDGEVVSADSMQIYKGMDIGTAKVTKEEMQNIPHHMIDIITPDKNFSVADYWRMAKECIYDIINRGKTPVICGGTGLYIDSLLNNIDFGGFEGDETIREQLSRLDNSELYTRLSEVDRISASRLHQNDRKRVIRALEVYTATKKPISYWIEQSRLKQPEFTPFYIVLEAKNRKLLYERIDKRVDKMFENGLVDEVKNLLDTGLTDKHTAVQAIGYKEVIEYLKGEYTLENAVETIKQESRRYAKRQMTWFRKHKTSKIVEICELNIEKLLIEIREFLEII